MKIINQISRHEGINSLGTNKGRLVLTGFAVIFCFTVLLFVSCVSQINGTISMDGSSALSVNIALQPRIAAMITSLSSAAGQAGEPILDGMSIALSMHGSPGVDSILLINISPTAVEGMIKLTNINEFLSSAANSNKFVNFDDAANRCQINISRGSASEILALLSPEITDYLNALMAPVATGEEMSKTEYLELVTMFYNKGISDEIAGSSIRVSIGFPGAITDVTGGTFTGRQANFNIPLLDILVLETPLVYEVKWNYR